MNIDKGAPRHATAWNASAIPTEADTEAVAETEADDATCTSMPPPLPPPRLCIRIPPSSHTQAGKKKKAEMTPDSDASLGSVVASELDQAQGHDEDEDDEEEDQTGPDETDDDESVSSSHEYRLPKASKSAACEKRESKERLARPRCFEVAAAGDGVKGVQDFGSY
jgi:hypothetical protein